MQQGGGLMAGDRVTPDRDPGRRDAKRMTLPRVGVGGFDGGPGRVHTGPHPHEVACPGQRPELSGC